MQYCCVNYNSICRHLPKSLKLLHSDNQDYLHENRWPPVWYDLLNFHAQIIHKFSFRYLKDYDYYQRCLKEQKMEMSVNKKNCRTDDNGCFGFSGGEWKRARE